MVLSSLKPKVDPAGTSTVSVAFPGFTLHVMSFEVTSVTGELFTGSRTAAVEVVLPVINVVHMSKGNGKMWDLQFSTAKDNIQCAEASWMALIVMRSGDRSFIFTQESDMK